MLSTYSGKRTVTFLLKSLKRFLKFAYGFHRLYRLYFAPLDGYFSPRAHLSSLSNSILGYYYIHADGRNAKSVELGVYSTQPFDKNGIPLRDYRGQKIYNPVHICQYALENHVLLLQTGKQKYRDTFLKQADWLIKHQEDGKWYHHYEIKERNLKAPWVSAMAQGQSISVLLRAWQLTEKSQYLEAAQKAFGTLKIPIDCDGVAYKGKVGTWFEEFPNPLAPSHVMNGHIFALFGIWDMYRVTHDPDAFRLFDEGVSVLKTDIGKYDIGFWVLYDQQNPNGLLNNAYLGLEIEQLKVMHALTKDSIFSKYLVRWENYQRSRRSFYKILSRKLLTANVDTHCKVSGNGDSL